MNDEIFGLIHSGCLALFILGILHWISTNQGFNALSWKSRVSVYFPYFIMYWVVSYSERVLIQLNVEPWAVTLSAIVVQIYLNIRLLDKIESLSMKKQEEKAQDDL